jgi:hypothetical protein
LPPVDVDDWSPDDAPETAADYAARTCQAPARCGCGGGRYCEQSKEEWFLRLAEEAERVDASLSPSCYAANLAHVAAPCDELGPIDPNGGREDPRCNMFVGDGLVGEACVEPTMPFVVPCAEGLYCDQGRCTPLVALGEPCSESHTCADGICLGVCVRPGLEGDSCENHRYCHRGYLCSGGVCTEGLAVGESCSLDWECASEICDEADHVCLPAAPLACYWAP